MDEPNSLEELLEHCKGCPHFSITEDGWREFYECSLLEEERVQEFEEDDPEYIPDGSEGLLAVAEYDIDGNLEYFEIMDFYPENCPKEVKNETQNQNP